MTFICEWHFVFQIRILVVVSQVQWVGYSLHPTSKKQAHNRHIIVSKQGHCSNELTWARCMLSILGESYQTYTQDFEEAQKNHLPKYPMKWTHKFRLNFNCNIVLHESSILALPWDEGYECHWENRFATIENLMWWSTMSNYHKITFT